MAIPFIQPDVKASVNELRLDLAFFFPELTHFYGYASGPDHNSRRCLDAMVYDSSDKYVGQQGRKNLPYSQRIALGNRVLAFLKANAKHYGLNGVIWNREVYGFPHDDAPFGRNHFRGPYGVARKYTQSAHDDHLHIDQDGRTFKPLRELATPHLPKYTVKAGDTLSKIAVLLGVPWQTIAGLNPGMDPNRLRVGQVITVPKAVPSKPVDTKPVEPKPEPTPVTKPKPITLALKAWDGSPAGRTLIQGVLWDEVNDCYFIHQADDVAGQAEQNVVIRRHKADGTYVGWATIVNGGHGSSVGLDPFDGGARLWLGHATLGAGHMAYNIGNDDTPFTKVPAIPKGDISIDAAADLLCVRVSTRYRGYKLSDARKNKATKVFDIKIPNWMTRFQGHTVTADRIFIHRDVKTKGASELRSYDFSGKLLRKWDTSGWGDEAEGAMVKKGWVYSVSRVGSNSPSRTVVCTPVEEY